MKKRMIEILLVLAGCLIASVGFNSLFYENNIASGGIIGLGVSLNKLLAWNPATFALIMNVPLLVACYLFLGRENLIKTLFASWVYPLFIKWTDFVPTITNNMLLAALFGGLIVGFGLWLVFLGNSSTGGTGIPSQILNKYSPLSLGLSMGIVDGMVVFISFLAFDVETVMYSIIALLVISYTVNTLEIGLQSSKNIMIISDKHEEIIAYIKEVTDRGVTLIPAIGGYSQKEKFILMTTLGTTELLGLKKNILQLDDAAFIVVMPATQVIGRGFSLHKFYNVANDEFIPPM